MDGEEKERILHQILHRLDDIERLIIQTYIGERKSMTQLDSDIKALATQFAQDTADQQALLSALTAAIANSTADDPTDDPTVQGIITAMQANHTSVTTTLANLGITVPPPSPAASQTAATAPASTETPS